MSESEIQRTRQRERSQETEGRREREREEEREIFNVKVKVCQGEVLPKAIRVLKNLRAQLNSKTNGNIFDFHICTLDKHRVVCKRSALPSPPLPSPFLHAIDVKARHTVYHKGVTGSVTSRPFSCNSKM